MKKPLHENREVASTRIALNRFPGLADFNQLGFLKLLLFNRGISTVNTRSQLSPRFCPFHVIR